MIYILIGLVLLEIFLRIRKLQYFEQIGRSIMLKEHVPNSTFEFNCKMPDKDFLTLKTDNNGFIIPNFVDKKTEEIITIAFIGGSVLECFWVSPNKRVPYLVAKKLSDKTGKSVRVLNACVSGANTHMSLNTLINKVIFYNPKYLFVSHCVNDAGILSQKKSYKKFAIGKINITAIRSIIFTFYLQALWQFILSKFRKPISETHPQKEFGEIAVDSEPFKDRLKMIIAVSRAMKIKPFICTQSYFRKVKSIQKGDERTFLSGIAYMDEFNEAIRKVAKDKKCDLIDLAKNIPASHQYYYDWIHFTDYGAEIVASEIFKHI